MANRKTYPGGFRLTLETARRLAIQEFGTAKGLEMDRSMSMEGYFRMTLGHLGIVICPDTGMSGCIKVVAGMSTADHQCVGYFNRETMEPDYEVMERYERQERRTELEQWVYGIGAEACHKVVDQIWERQV